MRRDPVVVGLRGSDSGGSADLYAQCGSVFKTCLIAHGIDDVVDAFVLGRCEGDCAAGHAGVDSPVGLQFAQQRKIRAVVR